MGILGTDWEAEASALAEKERFDAMDQLELAAFEKAVTPTAATQNSQSAMVKGGAWKHPPKRGARELLHAYIVSPPLRTVVDRVATSFASVDFWAGEDVNKRDDKHPAIKLLNDYNENFFGSQGRKLDQIYLDIPGESISIIAPSKDREKKIDIFPMPPTDVTIESKAGEVFYAVRMGDKIHEFPKEFVLHQRDINPMDPYGRGAGAGWAAGDEIQTDEYISKHVTAYYFNSAKPEFIGVLKDAGPEQLKTFSRDFDNQHRGFRRHWSPVWLGSEIEIHNLTTKLGDEGTNELRYNALQYVRWIYGVPPEIVGMVDNSNRATIQEAEAVMGRYVIDPRARARQDFWQWLCDELFDGAKIQYDSPIPKIFDRRDEIMSRHAHHFTRNEVRREAGFAPVNDGNIYMVPVNLTETAASVSLAQASKETEVLHLVLDNESEKSVG